VVQLGSNSPKDVLDDLSLKTVRRRARTIQLLDAAERAGITPISAARFHAFAYLADVLSPVWNLLPFDGKILKIEGGPHYPELQDELDRLVVLGLVEIKNLRYVDRAHEGARIDGIYALRFDSQHLQNILSFLGLRKGSEAFDPNDLDIQAFLVELAGALATVPDDEIDVAATVDATYADKRIATSNIVDFASWTEEPHDANLSARVTERFKSFLPQGALLSPGEKIYVYASYLSRRIHGKRA